jgi:hypothetical protein
MASTSMVMTHKGLSKRSPPLAADHLRCDLVPYRTSKIAIFPEFPFFNGDVILLRNIGKELLHPLLNLALQHIAPVLGRPDQVVESIVDSLIF